MPPMDCLKAAILLIESFSTERDIFITVENFLQYGNLAFGFSYVLLNSTA